MAHSVCISPSLVPRRSGRVLSRTSHHAASRLSLFFGGLRCVPWSHYRRGTSVCPSFSSPARIVRYRTGCAWRDILVRLVAGERIGLGWGVERPAGSALSLFPSDCLRCVSGVLPRSRRLFVTSCFQPEVIQCGLTFAPANAPIPSCFHLGVAGATSLSVIVSASTMSVELLNRAKAWLGQPQRSAPEYQLDSMANCFIGVYAGNGQVDLKSKPGRFPNENGRGGEI